MNEIGELSFDHQAKLLRPLQDGVITRVGGRKTTNFSARVIADMNRDLHAMLADGTFRADLYWRLSNLIIRVPGRAERGDDAAEMAQWVLRENLTASPKAMLSQKSLERLLSHNWPGGFRALRSILTSPNFRFPRQTDV